MKNCPKCGKELKDEAKFCGGCGTKLDVVEVGDKASIKCPKCGAKLKKGAKFCGACGTKLDAAEETPAQENASAESEPAPTKRQDFSLVGGYIHWNVLPGQIAVKIDEGDIAAYGRVKGVSVQDGVKALFFVQGKLIAELEAGNYGFKDMGVDEFTPAKNPKPAAEKPEEKAAKKKGFFARTIGAISSFLPGKHKERAAAAGLTSRIPASIPPVSIVLIRSAEFPFVFDFKDIGTANLHSEVGISFLCKINNFNEFYANQLLDSKFVCFESISKAVEPVVENILNVSLASVSPERINANPELQQTIMQQIEAGVGNVYQYLTASKIISLTAKHEELDALRHKREELYVSEQELGELTRRNEFVNRLQDENNRQTLSQARTQVEFEAAMEQIDERHEMNKVEREKFRMMLETERKIREAKNDDDLQNALMEFTRNGILRAEELENLEHLVKQRENLRDLEEGQVLTLATMQSEFDIAKKRKEHAADLTKIDLENDFEISTIRIQHEADINKLQAGNEADLNKFNLQNDIDLDKMKLQREMEVGNARIENELNRQRMQDEYTDSRRDKELDAEARRRRQEIELDNAEMDAQMERLRQAQEIRANKEKFEQDLRHSDKQFEHDLSESVKDKEHQRSEESLNSQHQRDMEKLNSQQDYDLKKDAQKLAHDENMADRYKEMTMEQIMAANPNLSHEAAMAIQAKYKAEADAAAANAAIAQNGKMEEMFKQMMAQKDATQSEMKELMMQMLASKDADKSSMEDKLMAMMQMMNANNQQNNATANANVQQMMQMFSQMGMSGFNATAGATAAANSAKIEGAENLTEAFKAQTQMVREDANSNQDRFLQGMQTTIQSVGGAMTKPSIVVQNRTTEAKGVKNCPKCGASVDDGDSFCPECGQSM